MIAMKIGFKKRVLTKWDRWFRRNLHAQTKPYVHGVPKDSPKAEICVQYRTGPTGEYKTMYLEVCYRCNVKNEAEAGDIVREYMARHGAEADSVTIWYLSERPFGKAA